MRLSNLRGSFGLEHFLSMTDSPSNQILVRYDVFSTKIFRVHAINFIGIRNKNSPGQIYFEDNGTAKSNDSKSSRSRRCIHELFFFFFER